MLITDTHVFFFSYADQYSNHYNSPFTVPDEPGRIFHTVEHYMMFVKAVMFGDVSTAEKILVNPRPMEAKKLGRQVKDYDDATWASCREKVVTKGLFYKMRCHPDIRLSALKLRMEGKRFVEASPYDRIWGIGMAEDNPLITDPVNWKGQNLLGKCWDAAIDLTLLGELP